MNARSRSRGRKMVTIWTFEPWESEKSAPLCPRIRGMDDEDHEGPFGDGVRGAGASGLEGGDFFYCACSSAVTVGPSDSPLQSAFLVSIVDTSSFNMPPLRFGMTSENACPQSPYSSHLSMISTTWFVARTCRLCMSIKSPMGS